MTNENLKPPSVADMLRMTGGKTAQFMEQVASHIEYLETEVARLSKRVTELEVANDAQ